MRKKQVITCLMIIGLIFLNLLPVMQLSPIAAQGSITVDEATCTLINAIITANTGADTGGCTGGTTGADTIILDADVTLTVPHTTGPYPSTDVDGGQAGLPDITSDITIQAGSGSTIARDSILPNDATNDFRIFHVATGGSLELQDITASNGYIEDSPASGDAYAYGGGIYNEGGTVTLTGSTLSGSSLNATVFSATADVTARAYGGGIYNAGGAVTLTGSTLSGNAAEAFDDPTNRFAHSFAWGGGIYNADGAGLTLTNSILSNNSTEAGERAFGGGILNIDDGTLTLANCMISDNSAEILLPAGASPFPRYPLAGGGGIMNFGYMLLTNSTISGNSASAVAADATTVVGAWGGGISTTADDVILTNSTLSDNSAYASAAEGSSSGGGRGGAITNNGEVTAYHLTLLNNTASHEADAFFQSGGMTMLTASIVASPGGLEDCSGTTLADGGFNLDGGDGSCPSMGTITIGTDIDGTLADNGCVTPLSDGSCVQTNALLAHAGNPAIDGVECIASIRNVDEREYRRVDGACDIGAYEVSSAPVSEVNDDGECEASGETIIISQAEYITKSVDNATPAAGDTVTYTITAHNPKDIPLTQVVIYDVFDERLERLTLVSTTHGTGVFTGNTLMVSGFSLQPGENATIVASAVVSANLAQDETIPNIAALESPDASVHVSNLVLLGRGADENDGAAITTQTILSAAGELPQTGYMPSGD